MNTIKIEMLNGSSFNFNNVSSETLATVLRTLVEDTVSNQVMSPSDNVKIAYLRGDISKIMAIKDMRSLHGINLKEAKDMVEGWGTPAKGYVYPSQNYAVGATQNTTISASKPSADPIFGSERGKIAYDDSEDESKSCPSWCFCNGGTGSPEDPYAND